jgi:hypothetical protein
MQDREATASELFVTFLGWARAASAKRMSVVMPSEDTEHGGTGVLTGSQGLEARE